MANMRGREIDGKYDKPEIDGKYEKMEVKG